MRIGFVVVALVALFGALHQLEDVQAVAGLTDDHLRLLSVPDLQQAYRNMRLQLGFEAAANLRVVLRASMVGYVLRGLSVIWHRKFKLLIVRVWRLIVKSFETQLLLTTYCSFNA